MSIPTQERRDDIIYFLLNKVKQTENQPQTVSFFADDFENKVVQADEVQQHLEYVIASGYLQGNAASSQSGDNAPLAVCDNAQLTSEGEQVLRNKFFKV
ncbi:MAG: hypothetical protein ACFCU7_20570 [Pleurocapsa sp.]